MAFPNRLKKLRLKQNWSQEELARKAGISRTAVGAIEACRLVPSVATALALAASFGCSVEDLFGPEKQQTDAAASWALPPPSLRCRFWKATVDGRILLYPVEFSDAGLLEHDGIAAEGEERAARSERGERTLVMACCDPAAGLLARQLAETAGVRLLVFNRSSREALGLLKRGLVHLAGIHLSAAVSNGNSKAVREELGAGYCLLRLARWQEGLALAPRLEIHSVSAALRANLRWVGREPGSGARQCLDALTGGGLKPRGLARSHRGVAEAVRSGWADAGVCLRLPAEEAGLKFLSVREETFDLCFRKDNTCDPLIDALTKVVRSKMYRRLLNDLPGYDSSQTGEIERIA